MIRDGKFPYERKRVPALAEDSYRDWWNLRIDIHERNRMNPLQKVNSIPAHPKGKAFWTGVGLMFSSFDLYLKIVVTCLLSWKHDGNRASQPVD